MKQSDVVADFKDRNLPVVSSSNVYKVALLVPDCKDGDKLQMDLCWYLQLQEFDVQNVECGCGADIECQVSDCAPG